MSNTTGTAYSESLKVIETIKTAWENGHTLVPLLGAGISVDSGMPPVDSIMTYLVMIRQYVRLRAYRPQYKAGPYKNVDEQYRQQPIRYIRHYGWPDPFQLRHELMLQYRDIDEIRQRESTDTDEEHRKYLEQVAEKKAVGTTFDRWIHQELANEVSQRKNWQKSEYEKLKMKYEDLRKKHEELIRKDPQSGEDSEREHAAFKREHAAFETATTWKVLGDWRAVIRDFTEFTPDDADSLFERLYRWHDPGRSHHYWAFLTRLMGLRLFLTTNFDNFLERALAAQGIDHRVFGVEQGDNLPHESLVRETVSVIKLHGDTHHLLLDERLDYPPSDAYLKRLQNCMPIRPVMVVMGCGGNDARTQEIVKRHGKRHKKVNDTPSVIWLHFEPAEHGRTLKKELGDWIQHARVTNPGMFLSHLYAYLRSQHPASRVPYKTHVARLVAPLTHDPSHDSSVACHENCENKAYIFEQRRAQSAGPRVAASQVMADFVYKKKIDEKYTPIWIDLETHHSFAGVVQQIVEQCRLHDSFVSPFDVPSSTTGRDPTATLTAKRLFHVLRRGRYVLAVDALEAFLWSPPAHHGASPRPEALGEIEQLFALLKALMIHSKLKDEIDVVLCASFDRFRERRSTQEQGKLLELLKALVKEVTGDEVEDSTQGGHSSDDNRQEPDPEELFVVSCFRRPRSLVSLRSVFKHIFGDEPDADERIEKLVHNGQLSFLEGGFYRMQHGPRDEIYSRRTQGTSTADVVEIVKAGNANRRDMREPIQRCFFLAFTHNVIARSYYTESYLHSQDPWIFFEYFYHRISSIRYYTKLTTLLEHLDQDDRKLLQLPGVVPPRAMHERRQTAGRDPFDRIHAHVTSQREELLTSLNHALIQAQSHLLNGLPAAQLEGWCTGILRNIFGFSSTSIERFDPKRCPLTKVQYGGKDDSDKCKDDMHGIFWTLLVLLRKSVYQQGRSKDASRLAWAQLKYRAAQANCDASMVSSDRDTKRILAALCGATQQGSMAAEECIQSFLDAIATPREERDAAASDEVAKSVLEIVAHYEAARPSTPLGKQNQLRAVCMLVEGKIAGSPGERFDACLRGKLSDVQADRDRWLDLIDQALDLCRLLNPEGVRDSSHDPYFLRFRGRLLVAKARLQWLGAEGLEPFRQADQLLESARASISADDYARLARLEMTWAEGLMLQANLSLNNPCPDQQDHRKQALADRNHRDQALAASQVSYQRAGDALLRAREHLTRSSRDVERWTSFQRLWTQYQAQWCLFHLARLESELRVLKVKSPYQHKRELAERTPRDMAALLKRLKRGLNGLQAGLVIQPDGSTDRRLWRVWLELLCAGMVYGVTTAAGTVYYEELLASSSPSSSPTWPLGISTFWEHWKSLNERAGIASTIETAGRYSDLLGVPGVVIRDPDLDSVPWRSDLVEKLRDRSNQVSKLRDEALKLVNDLYSCEKGEQDRFANILTKRMTELVAPSKGSGDDKQE